MMLKVKFVGLELSALGKYLCQEALAAFSSL